MYKRKPLGSVNSPCITISAEMRRLKILIGNFETRVLDLLITEPAGGNDFSIDASNHGSQISKLSSNEPVRVEHTCCLLLLFRRIF